MELSAAGADLLGANEAAVLRALARLGRAVSGRDVARLAGLGPSSARRALLRLERIGLIDAQDSSHARLYALQRGHVLWEPVRLVLTASARVQQELGALTVERVGERATVALFGSVARGEAGADSDVDVAVVWHGDTGGADSIDVAAREELVDTLTERIEVMTGNAAQVYAVDAAGLAEMVRSGDPLVTSWAADAVTLAGPDLQRLLRELRKDRPGVAAGSAATTTGSSG